MTPHPSDQRQMFVPERDVLRAIGHLKRWHRIGLVIAALISFVPALLAVRYGGRVDTLKSISEGFADLMPFVNTPTEVQVTMFVFGSIVLLVLTGIGAGIASDIVRIRILARLNAQDSPVALAEAMKNHLKARTRRMAKQYRFFPKFEEAGKLQPHGVYVGIGTLVPYLALLLAFAFYFKV